MATNRHAQVRYNILDRCFSNFNRLYSYDDLLDEVNTVLFEIGTEGIKLRQLQYDIEHMASGAGWSVEFEHGLKKARKKAWRYKDHNFSIANHPLNVSDRDQLETTLSILSRYKHREEFGWLEELIPRIKQAFDIHSESERSIISYQQNFDLVGREYIGVLFNLILKKKKIRISYRPFGKEATEILLSPFHLKQYNNRWFLFAKHPDYSGISNYPLDRIESIEECAEAAESTNIDWMDYFEDIIGVTHPNDTVLEKIVLRFSERRFSYITTKPLHGTQKILKGDGQSNTISIEVKPNKELMQVLLSFGADVEILEPETVRQSVKNEYERMASIY